jgi:hypothetical protein
VNDEEENIRYRDDWYLFIDHDSARRLSLGGKVSQIERGHMEAERRQVILWKHACAEI